MLSITKSLIIIDIVVKYSKYLYPVQATHYFDKWHLFVSPLKKEN